VKGNQPKRSTTEGKLEIDPASETKTIHHKRKKLQAFDLSLIGPLRWAKTGIMAHCRFLQEFPKHLQSFTSGIIPEFNGIFSDDVRVDQKNVRVSGRRFGITQLPKQFHIGWS
jgi:hypothetical protein